ncbi:PAS domain S-box protein [bacterium]|nr:PAS domain S-box protein [bacterium]
MERKRKKTVKDLLQEIEVLRKRVDELEHEKSEYTDIKQDLRNQETRMKNLIYFCKAGYFKIDRNGRIENVNEAWVRLHHFVSRNEVIGLHIIETVVEIDIPEAEKMIERVMAGEPVVHHEFRRRCDDGAVGYHSLCAVPVVRNDIVIGMEGLIVDTTETRRAEYQHIKLFSQLDQALDQINTLSGMIPICASCKKIRDDQGYWNQVEKYISEHSQAEFTHSICPDCQRILYPDLFTDNTTEET